MGGGENVVRGLKAAGLRFECCLGVMNRAITARVKVRALVSRS